MKNFIGVKQIRAVEMTLQEYEKLRGFKVSEDATNANGYLVEYMDGGRPNVEGFDGYISWSPKDVFERAYRHCNGITFGLALEAIKQGLLVKRNKWESVSVIAMSVTGKRLTCMEYDKDTCTALYGEWSPKNEDIFAEDWEIVEGNIFKGD